MAKLVRWNPAFEINRAFDRMFDDARSGGHFRRAELPALDIINHDDHVEVQVDLPGVDPETVNIECKDNLLTISTEINTSETHESGNYTYRERYQGAYQRSLRLGDNIDVEKAEAAFENGVLSVKLPYKPEKAPLKIAVKGGKTEK